MLKTIQIIALIQGLFLLLILFKNKSKYKEVTFWLFTFTIVSTLLFIIGDDENNLFQNKIDWFFFDSTLFITFLFLFFKYYRSKQETFNPLDLLFFIPNIIYFSIEVMELNGLEENSLVEIGELLVEFSFLSYLIAILYKIVKDKSRHWVLFLVVPIVLILGLHNLNELLALFNLSPLLITEDRTYSSFELVIIAFLFYFITFYFINSPKKLLPIAKQKKYKTSNLSKKQIEVYKAELIMSMEKDRLYRDQKLSIQKLSQKLTIPSQYLSEVLNLHIGKSFIDFVNEYRVEEFIEKLQDDRYNHFTLLGIANEVGFGSKSTFNSTFKKIKGLTPSEFKRSLDLNP